MKRLLFIPLIGLLSGCFLNQSDPAAKLPTKANLLGAIAVEDLVISNQGELAFFQAQFALKPPTKRSLSMQRQTLQLPFSVAATRQQATRELFNAPSRSPECQKIKMPKQPAPNKEADTPSSSLKLISVGRLGFGPVLQDTLLIMQPDQKNTYQSKLKAGVPAYMYQVVAEGTDQVQPFSELLSFPEHVAYLRLNGMDFGDPIMEFHPDQGLQLFWREPSAENSQNGILVHVSTQDDQNVYRVLCGKMEENIPSVSGFKEWNLDKGWFSEFPKTGKIHFYFLRAHQRDAVTKTSAVQLQGARTFYSHIDIGS